MSKVLLLGDENLTTNPGHIGDQLIKSQLCNQGRKNNMTPTNRALLVDQNTSTVGNLVT